MRPTFLLACLWASWACAQVATAQAPPSRPSALQDSGVINRASPPISLGGGTTANSTQSSYAQSQFPAPPSQPASAALSDQAWTSSPAQPATQPANPAIQSAQSAAAGRATDAPALPPVMTAQYTSSDRFAASASASQVRAASYQAPAAAAPAHEPRPLKPPTASEAKANSKGSTGTVQMFISVMSSLAIVIGLILVAAWFYRKAAPSISGALPKQVVQVLGRTPLAPRQQLVLLRLGSKLVLVSNLHGEVRTISEITDPLEVDRLSGLCESVQPGSISESFRSVLHNIGRNG